MRYAQVQIIRVARNEHMGGQGEGGGSGGGGWGTVVKRLQKYGRDKGVLMSQSIT